jgi:putative membrane protein
MKTFSSALLFFLGASSSAAAFVPASSHAATKSLLYMGPPVDPSAPATDLYGEGSRKYRRTVYTQKEWVKHRSPDRFVNNLSTLMNSGIYKNVGNEVFATTYVATFVWTWNLLIGGYNDFSGVMHDPLIHSNWAITSIGLPLTIFTTLSPSLGLLLGE